uniref:Transmembrane protein n=1 Tax=Trypanosoma congolense (strain IL3000) TaxID=1068625 RepID=G0UKG1_TRYCI|nr:conserved hypothetical protein [Trypanosoma congolense IL3000]
MHHVSSVVLVFLCSRFVFFLGLAVQPLSHLFLLINTVMWRIFCCSRTRVTRVNFGHYCGCSLYWQSAAGSYSRADGGGASDVLPPKPASYIPPEERPPDDASLRFLRKGIRKGQTPPGVHQDVVYEVNLGQGQMLAPELPSLPDPPRNYMNERAAALSSSSVHAGESLLPTGAGIGATRLAVVANSAPESKSFRAVSSFPFSQPSRRDASIFEFRDPFDEGPRGSGPMKYERASEVAGKTGTTSGDNSAGDEIPFLQRMHLDLRRLEYYQGTAQYPDMLKEFRSKYFPEGKMEDGGDSGSTPSRPLYTAEELERGLEAQPIDFLRASDKLKMELTSGPRAYDPVVIMQQFGVMRFKGYAFPPTLELGKLRDREGNVLDPGKSAEGLLSNMSQGVSATTTLHLREYKDKPVLSRVLGLDDLQRRQVKAVLSDFDYSDHHTTYHVMMSYPYTDWLHVFYMVSIGLMLYELQICYDAYDFYDEYLGLDLRQVPELKKPFLVVVTVSVMVMVMFHPLLLASIATTRLYRIAMKRPIGPP